MEDRLYKKLEAYGRSDFYPFHMPGHKRNPLAVDGDFPVERDITEINGFDNLHHAEDILKIYAETKENPLHFPGEKFLEVKRNTSHRRWIKKHPQAVQD